MEAQTRFSTSTQRTKRQGAYVEGEMEEESSWELKWRKNIQLLRDTFSESAKSPVYCCQGGETSSNGKAETPAVAKILPQSSHGSFSGIVLILTDCRVDSSELVHTTIA